MATIDGVMVGILMDSIDVIYLFKMQRVWLGHIDPTTNFPVITPTIGITMSIAVIALNLMFLHLLILNNL